MISLNYFSAGFTFFQDQQSKNFEIYFFQIEGGLGALDELECVRTWAKAHLREFGIIWSRLKNFCFRQTSTYSHFGRGDYFS